MSIETDARTSLGLLIKDARAERRINRGQFAHLVGVKTIIITRMEHGVVNPTRSEFVKAIKVLRLTDRDNNRAYAFLRIFSPRRRNDKKFYMPVTVLKYRKANRQGRRF